MRHNLDRVQGARRHVPKGPQRSSCLKDRLALWANKDKISIKSFFKQSVFFKTSRTLYSAMACISL